MLTFLFVAASRVVEHLDSLKEENGLRQPSKILRTHTMSLKGLGTTSSSQSLVVGDIDDVLISRTWE